MCQSPALSDRAESSSRTKFLLCFDIHLQVCKIASSMEATKQIAAPPQNQKKLHISSPIQGEPCRKRPRRHSILGKQSRKQIASAL
jgi:hypothetical protein